MSMGKKRVPDFIAGTGLVPTSTDLHDEFKSTIDLGRDFVPASSTIIQGSGNATNQKGNH